MLVAGVSFSLLPSGSSILVASLSTVLNKELVQLTGPRQIWHKNGKRADA